MIIEVWSDVCAVADGEGICCNLRHSRDKDMDLG